MPKRTSRDRARPEGGPLRPPLTVRLTNRRASFPEADPDELVSLKKYFRFRDPGCERSQLYLDGAWDGFHNLLMRGGVAAGLFLRKRARLAEVYDLTVDDRRVAPGFREVTDEGARGYQDKACAAMIRASRTGGIVLMATGSGKTRLAAEYFRRLTGHGLFLVDELSLMQQSREEIQRVLGEEVGVVGGGVFRPTRVTVATSQTLQRRSDHPDFKRWLRRVQVVIIDENHVAVNERTAEVVRAVAPLAVFGLTATLQLGRPEVRLPAVELAGPVIFRYPISEGVREGFLVGGKVLRLAFHDPLRGPAPGYRSGGRFIEPWTLHAEYRHRISLNRARNDLIEAMAREAIRRGHRVVVLVEQVVHLRVLARRFGDVPHRTASGNRELSGDPSLRVRTMKEMDAGDVPLILANRVFGRGANIRTVDVVIDGTGMPGRNGAIQRYGRGVRKAEGKEGLLYIDVADRGNRFGGAAGRRAEALLETGAEVVEFRWAGDAVAAFDALCREE